MEVLSEDPPTMDGNLQRYIIWHANEACKKGSDAAISEYVETMSELLNERSSQLSRKNISSIFHRCARAVNATIQARTHCTYLENSHDSLIAKSHHLAC